MNFSKDKFVFTGSTGRFGRKFREKYNLTNFFYPSKKQLNIRDYHSINKFLKKVKPKVVIHAAAISRPMNAHETKPQESIKTNIIGTCNLVIACKEMGIKIIYFSTNYVYPIGKKSHKETDPVLPINAYAFSKLGGECAVQMYNNSLILRIFMTEKPFLYPKAYIDVMSNYLYQDEVINIFPKIINLKGIINIGGKIQSIYQLAKKTNSKVKKIYAKKILKEKYFKYQIINTAKLKKILKSKKL
jgi:dTDP-4-dehydrorhamnose reductase